MTPYIFRKARHGDLSDILRLLNDDELGKEREGSEVSSCYQEAFTKISSDPNQLLMVIEADGAVVGTCHLTLMPSLTFQGSLRMNIEAVRIASPFRGQGIGEWMFQEIFKMARDKGCKIIQLTTNKKRKDARRFYEQLGFAATHEGMKLYL